MGWDNRPTIKSPNLLYEVQYESHIGIPREHWEQAIYVFDVSRRSLDLVPIDPENFQKARSLLQR